VLTSAATVSAAPYGEALARRGTQPVEAFSFIESNIKMPKMMAAVRDMN